MAGRNVYFITGGILLVGGAAGLAYWYYVIEKPPKSIITASYIRPEPDGSIYVAADVRNVGRSKGYFKIQAILVSPECPYQGDTGYPRRGGSNWMNILNWVFQTGKGAWLGYEPGQGWQEIPPGSVLNLRTPAVRIGKDQRYNLYINAAVSKDGTTQGRLWNREYYKWAPGQTI